MTSIRSFVRYFNNKTTILLQLFSVLLLNITSSQAQNSSSSALLEEIVVTATKKKNVENVHDIPSSVTAFGADQLEALKIRDLVGLNFAVPNATIQEVGTTKGGASFAIRGLGINSSIPSIEPTVGVFVDGIYYGINSGVVFDTFDLKSIEVLRGPQGVLFGRNVTGGALIVNTTDPGFEPKTTLKVAAESGFRGTGANYFIQGSTTGTLIEDTLAGKIAVYYNDDKGWFKNTLADGSKTDFGASDTFIIRPAITWTPSESLSITAKYEYGEFSGDGPAAQSHINGIEAQQENAVGDFRRNSFDFSVNENTFNDSEWQNLVIETNLDVSFGDGRITNIFGYREFDSDAFSDIDATSQRIFDGEVVIQQEQISNELRFNGQFGKWNITTGLFYFEQDLSYSETRFLLEDFFSTLGLPALTLPGGGIQDQQTFGIFAQTEYQVNDRLSLSAGLRYSDEAKEVKIASIVAGLQADTTCRVSNNDCIFDFSELSNPGDATFSTDNLSPQIGIKYVLNDSSNIYASWNRSFRAGGFNLRNTSADIKSLNSFDDEEVDALELGWKYQSINNSTLNVALFLTKIDDLQREVNSQDTAVGTVQVVRNTANAEIKGFEIDGKLAITDNLILTGSFGYTDGEYNDLFFDLTGDGVINQNDFDLEIPRLTNTSYSLGLIYNQRLGRLGDGHLQINYGRKSDTSFTDDNLGFIDDTERLDASITLMRDSGTSLSLFGKNLTNEVLFTADTQLPQLLGATPLGGTFSPLTKGRVIGLELEHSF